MNKLPIFIDLGSGEIKAIVARPQPQSEKLEVLWQDSLESRGIKRGVVLSPQETAFQVKRLIERACSQVQEEFFAVYNLNGSHLTSLETRADVVVSRADNRISQEDIKRVHKASESITLPSNYEVIANIPKEYRVDKQPTPHPPLGLHGMKLEINSILVAGFYPYIKNSSQVFRLGDIETEDPYLTPLCSALATTTAQERDLGVIVIDIGFGTTSFAVFLEGSLRSLGVIPIGSSHLSNDIALEFQLNIEVAEQIKLEHGKCFLGGRGKIKIKISDKEEITISQKRLGEVIDARVKEIFDLLYKQIKSKSTLKLPAGIVLTGGGSRLQDIEKMAQNRFGLVTRKGYNLQVSSLEKDPRFSCAIGMAKLWWSDKDVQEYLYNNKGWTSKIIEILKGFIP